MTRFLRRIFGRRKLRPLFPEIDREIALRRAKHMPVADLQREKRERLHAALRQRRGAA